jgi:hypothetical protein
LWSDECDVVDDEAELVRVNAQLAQVAERQRERAVSILGECRRYRASLRDLAVASMKALPPDDRALVMREVNAEDDIPF